MIFFLQIKGSPMAHNFANLYVRIEHPKILNPRTNAFFPDIMLWKRFIDDVFVLFHGPDFFEYLNSLRSFEIYHDL